MQISLIMNVHGDLDTPTSLRGDVDYKLISRGIRDGGASCNRATGRLAELAIEAPNDWDDGICDVPDSSE